MKKKAAANKHGKGRQVTKKGAKFAAPKRKKATHEFQEHQMVSKIIHAKNEEKAAGAASNSGARLTVVKAAATTTGDKKAPKKNKTAEQAKKAVKNPFVL